MHFAINFEIFYTNEESKQLGRIKGIEVRDDIVTIYYHNSNDSICPLLMRLVGEYINNTYSNTNLTLSSFSQMSPHHPYAHTHSSFFKQALSSRDWLRDWLYAPREEHTHIKCSRVLIIDDVKALIYRIKQFEEQTTSQREDLYQKIIQIHQGHQNDDKNGILYKFYSQTILKNYQSLYKEHPELIQNPLVILPSYDALENAIDSLTKKCEKNVGSVESNVLLLDFFENLQGIESNHYFNNIDSLQALPSSVCAQSNESNLKQFSRTLDGMYIKDYLFILMVALFFCTCLEIAISGIYNAFTTKLKRM